MKIYLYDNSQLKYFFEKELVEKFEAIKIADYKEVSNNGLLIFINDNLDLDLDNRVTDYCRTNSITYISMKMLGYSCYIGPLTTSKTADLKSFMNKLFAA